MMSVTKFKKPYDEIKSVIVFLHGKYPHISTPDKDISLPQRLFPNAEFYIRCNTRDLNTKIYFNEIYKNYKIHFIDEKSDISKLVVDAVFVKQERFAYFGGVIEKFCIDYNIMLNTFKNKIFILYNDEFLRPFDSLKNEYEHRHKNFYIRNKQQLDKIYELSSQNNDYSNITILANDDRLSDWIIENNLISQSAINKNINLTYLTDNILYDLKINDSSFRKFFRKGLLVGGFISLFFSKRISTWNKIMKDEQLYLDVYGPGSDKLKYYKPEKVITIKNNKIDEYYKHKFDYSIYIGKGTESKYLGATFFVPLQNHCPIFIWSGTDTNKKIFPNLNCYFDDDKHLFELLKKYESNTLSLNKLLKQQQQILK